MVLFGQMYEWDGFLVLQTHVCAKVYVKLSPAPTTSFSDQVFSNFQMDVSQLTFYINLQRAVSDPSAMLTER